MKSSINGNKVDSLNIKTNYNQVLKMFLQEPINP